MKSSTISNVSKNVCVSTFALKFQLKNLTKNYRAIHLSVRFVSVRFNPSEPNRSIGFFAAGVRRNRTKPNRKSKKKVRPNQWNTFGFYTFRIYLWNRARNRGYVIILSNFPWAKKTIHQRVHGLLAPALFFFSFCRENSIKAFRSAVSCTVPGSPNCTKYTFLRVSMEPNRHVQILCHG